MSFEKTPAGTRGASMPGASSSVAKWMGNQMIKRARRKGGTNTLVLTTIGAKTGQRRETLLGGFPDGDNAWLIIASFGGNAKNPAWYHNLAAHPDQAEIEIGGRKVKVTATQLSGPEREAAWQRVVAIQPRYAGYVKKTDRVIPVIRLVAA